MTVLARIERIFRAKLRHLSAARADETADWEVDGRAGDPGLAAAPRSVRETDLAILELRPGATPEEIRKAYREMCKRYHPDRFAARPEKAEIANELLREINRAYRALQDDDES